MKNIILIVMSALMLTLGGKDLRQLVLTPTPEMHCASCENKIKGNLRFEKGVTKIETSLEAQTVTITYNPKKTSPKVLQAAMKKIGYDTRGVRDGPANTKKK